MDTDAYYKQDKYNANTEAFANLLAIDSSGHPLAQELLETIAPSGFAVYRKALEGLTK